jgi:hypothetical protein
MKWNKGKAKKLEILSMVLSRKHLISSNQDATLFTQGWSWGKTRQRAFLDTILFHAAWLRTPEQNDNWIF